MGDCRLRFYRAGDKRFLFQKSGRLLGKRKAFPGGGYKRLIALGLPLLRGQNSPFVLLSVFGVMLETIIVMAVYNTRIEKKYKSGRG